MGSPRATSPNARLQVETEVFEWEEGGQNGYKLRLPGRLKYSNLVLKRGLALLDLWDWFSQTAEGKIDARPCPW